MSNNIIKLKRLFDEACQTMPPACVLASLLNGRPINKAKTSLLKASRLIEKSPVNISTLQSQNQDSGNFTDRLLELNKKLGRGSSPDLSFLSPTERSIYLKTLTRRPHCLHD